MEGWTGDIVEVVSELGGTASYEEIYAGVQRSRPDLPASWKDIVRRQIQESSSDSPRFKHRADLFFSVGRPGRAVWGLRSYVHDSPEAADLPEGASAHQTTYRVLRDTVLARQIKLLHRDHCQLCDKRLTVTPTLTYSEAHHVIPLGRPHDGPDTAGNIIVLCPNHHALCDLGAIRLDRSDIRMSPGHDIDQASLDYHNANIVGSRGAGGGRAAATGTH